MLDYGRICVDIWDGEQFRLFKRIESEKERNYKIIVLMHENKID